MAVSTIKANKEYVVKDVVFTYSNYNLWRADTRFTGKVVKSTQANYLIAGDGSEYVRIFDLSQGTIVNLDTSKSPFTIPCIVLPN